MHHLISDDLFWTLWMSHDLLLSLWFASLEPVLTGIDTCRPTYSYHIATRCKCVQVGIYYLCSTPEFNSWSLGGQHGLRVV